MNCCLKNIHNFNNQIMFSLCRGNIVMGHLSLMYPRKINYDIIVSLWAHATERVYFPTVFNLSIICTTHTYNDIIKYKMFVELPQFMCI